MCPIFLQAGSVTLHRKESEGLYESDTVGVPVGEHVCQLAVGGDVVPTEPFEINEESDVIFIIIGEGTERPILGSPRLNLCF